MPVTCEFEEDAFQQAVDIAFSKTTNIFTTPGRVSESILGYDAAFFIDTSSHFKLLRRVAYQRSARYLKLHGVNITDDFFDDLAKLSKNPPKFKLNLFVQYKVPEKMVGTKAKEWKNWGGDYYRYSIRQKQLKILCDLEDRAAGRALVCYSSPAFISSDRLEECVVAGTVIENTNFVSAGMLKGHFTYTYQTALGIGLAHSEVAEATPIDLRQTLSNLASTEREQNLPDAISEIVDIILRTDWGNQTYLGKEGKDKPRGFLDNIEIIRKFERYSGTKLYLFG